MIMIEGWLLDVHENEVGTGMLAWVVDDAGKAHACPVPWYPSLHVHASVDELDRLEHWLEQPEIILRFGLLNVRTTRARLDLEMRHHSEVLEVSLRSFRGRSEEIACRDHFH